jgi:hypothetical protein
MNGSTATADTPLRQAGMRLHGESEPTCGKVTIRRDVIERDGSSEAWYGGLAPRGLDALFQVRLGLSALRAPVSHGVSAVSSRTVMNNVG